MPKDTLQNIYRNDYKPYGIKKREVAAHSGMTILAIFGMVLAAPVVIPVITTVSAITGPFQGLVSLSLIGGGMYAVIKMIDREDPLEVRKRELAKKDALRAEVIEEIRNGRLLR